jgi:hypothetical protein
MLWPTPVWTDSRVLNSYESLHVNVVNGFECKTHPAAPTVRHPACVGASARCDGTW